MEWFGPVTRVRAADALTRYPDRTGVNPDRPTHVEATLELADGPFIRLTASLYVPHRAREFYSVELHGDDGSCYLADAGSLGGSEVYNVEFARAGQEYTPVPLQHPPRATPSCAGPAALAESIRRGRPSTASARRGAHIITVCNAIERAAEHGGPVPVDDSGFVPEGLPGSQSWPESLAPSADQSKRDVALRIPPIGFGCSRYRDGEYVDRQESVATALDAGYRLLDSAELYGNERRIGRILDIPGSPDRESLFFVGKAWNTNHEHVREACRASLDRLKIDTFDCYTLHWPEAWEYTGPLGELAELPVEEQEARAFPQDDADEIRTADVPLSIAWKRLEALHDDGLARTLGICNIDRETLDDLLTKARVPPAIVQIECHPYRPRTELIKRCHERGIRVLAHSPLSVSGLIDEPVLESIADAHDVTPAQVVLAWNIGRGVVPIPASVDPEHIVENAAAAGLRLTDVERECIETLIDPGFER